MVRKLAHSSGVCVALGNSNMNQYLSLTKGILDHDLSCLSLVCMKSMQILL